MPSPFGEGQTDTPINHHPLGEVPLLPSLFPPPFGFDLINLCILRSYCNFRYNENIRATNVLPKKNLPCLD